MELSLREVNDSIGAMPSRNRRNQYMEDRMSCWDMELSENKFVNSIQSNVGVLKAPGCVSCISELGENDFIVAGTNNATSGYQRIFSAAVNKKIPNYLAIFDTELTRTGICVKKAEHEGDVLDISLISSNDQSCLKILTCSGNGRINIFSFNLSDVWNSVTIDLAESKELVQLGADILAAVDVTDNTATTVSENGSIFVVDLNRMKSIRENIAEDNNRLPLADIAILKESENEFATVGSAPHCQLRLWDSRSNLRESVLSFESPYEFSPYHCVAQNSFAREMLAVGSNAGYVDMWDIRSPGKILDHRLSHNCGVSSIISHAQCRKILTAGKDGKIQHFSYLDDGEFSRSNLLAKSPAGGFVSSCYSEIRDRLCSVTKQGFLLTISQLRKLE